MTTTENVSHEPDSLESKPEREIVGRRPSVSGHQSVSARGIETFVLDDGPGRGVRIAWVNTGGGLRYKVVIDRGLDIADAEFKGRSLS